MLNKNSLVLYRNQPAVITAAADKYTIEYYVPSAKAGKQPEKTEQKVRSKDIIPLSIEPVTSLRQAAQAALSQIPYFAGQLEEIGELLASGNDEEGQTVSFSEIAELCSGYSPDTAWALYSAVLQSPLFALREESAPAGDAAGPVFRFRSPQEMQRIREKEEAKQKEAAEKQAFIDRLKRRALELPHDIRFMQEVEAVALGKSDKSKVLKDVCIAETPEKAHKLLLDTGIWDIMKNPYPSRWGLSLRSADETLASPPEEERYQVPGTAYAIDSEWSADPDDAIAFDGEYLWVHVADPASTVMPESAIDTAARNRGATLYLPEGAARMLAEESLEDYALGLSPLSRALSFRIKLDTDGSISDCAVMKTLVSVKRLTYEEADEMMDSPSLLPLFSIARRNIARRENAGAVSISLPETHISVSDGKVRIEPIRKTVSGDAVREAMLLAGEAAARFAFKNNIPFPYISQEAPDLPKDMPGGLAGQYRLRRCMRGRSVGITPSSHAGLGLGMYSQVTSPLRRYGDLAAHQQLRAFLDGRKPADSDTLLERIAAGDAAAGAAVKAERKSRLHWALVYLLQNPDWTGEAVAVEHKGKQTVFLIPELAQETILIPSKTVPLNETIKVRAGKIQLPELAAIFTEI